MDASVSFGFIPLLCVESVFGSLGDSVSPWFGPLPMIVFGKKSEFLIETAIRLISTAALASVILIIVFIAKEAFPLLTDPLIRGEGLGSLFGWKWQPVNDPALYGLIPLAIGTLKVSLIAIAIAGPLGIMAAVYNQFYANKKLREYIKPTIELLAGFPSVVIGFIFLALIATYIQSATGARFRLNALTGGLAIALAIVPTVFTIAEESLSKIPIAINEASFGLGATKVQTITRVAIPYAFSGIFAGLTLGFGRAIGETMIALLITGNAALSDPSIMTPVRTFAATIGSEMGEVVFGDTHYTVLFALGFILLCFTVVINVVSVRLFKANIK